MPVLMSKFAAQVMCECEKHWTPQRSSFHRGKWMVWSSESDHEVEFDDVSIARAEDIADQRVVDGYMNTYGRKARLTERDQDHPEY